MESKEQQVFFGPTKNVVQTNRNGDIMHFSLLHSLHRSRVNWELIYWSL